jgi:hypothetical protein
METNSTLLRSISLNTENKDIKHETKLPFVVPKLTFVIPKLTKRGKFHELTTQFVGTFTV